MTAGSVTRTVHAVTGRGGIRLVVAGSAAVCCLALTPGAGASITVGNNLATVPVTGFCGAACTIGLGALPAAQQAAGGTQITTPGVVVRWRLRTGPGVAPVRTRLRILSGNSVVATSGEETMPAQAGIYTFPARIPVQPGQQLGVDLLDPNPDQGVPIGTQSVPGSSSLFWIPPLAENETRAPTSTGAQLALYLNAEVEPDTDADGFGDESQDACPAAAPDHTLPCGPPSAVISKAPKRRTRSRKAEFVFASDDPAATFECRVDAGPFTACASPHKLRVRRGKHKLWVRAVDADGIATPVPMWAKWRVLKRR